jgi:hypothetical protein
MAADDIIPASENPDIASLQRIAAALTAFSIPWPHSPQANQNVGLCQSFHMGDAVSSWPFYGPSAFDLTHPPAIDFVSPTGKDVWSEITTTSVGSNHEHIGVSGGVGIGCSFLGGSATVNYDKDTYTNTNVSTCRLWVGVPLFIKRDLLGYQSFHSLSSH